MRFREEDMRLKTYSGGKQEKLRSSGRAVSDGKLERITPRTSAQRSASFLHLHPYCPKI